MHKLENIITSGYNQITLIAFLALRQHGRLQQRSLISSNM